MGTRVRGRLIPRFLRALGAALLVAVARPVGARGQAVPVPAPVRDAQPVVLETILGGDSGQAAVVVLRRGADYRVEVRPAQADVLLRRRTTAPGPNPPLDTVAVPRGDSLYNWRSFGVHARDAGEHVVELTNPGIGAARLRIVLVRRAPGDTLLTSERRQLVYSEHVGIGPVFITLDSGVVYRFLPSTAMTIAPRSGYRAPLHIAPVGVSGAIGYPLIPEFTGEFRVDSDDPAATLRVYREELDAQAMRCLRDPRAGGCRGVSVRRRSMGVLMAMLAVPIGLWMVLH